MLDVFNSDLFTMVELTTAINKLPHKPGRITQLGIFEQAGVSKTTVVVEEQEGLLALLPSKPRGSTQTLQGNTRPRGQAFVVPHIPFDDAVLADDVQNRRRFGSMDEEESAIALVNDKLQRMRNSHEVTKEWLLAGALQGSVVDGDGSTVLVNLFTSFGVAETSFDFTLGTSTTVQRSNCLKVIDAIENALGTDINAGYQHIHCLAGKDWFRRFVDHADVRYAYERFQDGNALRSDPRSGFEFAGITFEEYRGRVGDKSLIPPNVARFFPVGVPELFKVHYAPADFMETVNTIGEPFYAKQAPMEFDKGIKIHTQSNPLPLCHRPKVLVKGTSSN